MGSRNEHAQNLALCQINEFYAEKYFPGVVLCVEFISDILKVRWDTYYGRTDDPHSKESTEILGLLIWTY